jgi:hypothetical protein
VNRPRQSKGGPLDELVIGFEGLGSREQPQVLCRLMHATDGDTDNSAKTST